MTGGASEARVASLDEAIDARRSVRSYLPRAIPPPVLCELLDLARRAPSSMDGQACHFVVVREPAARRALADLKNRHCPPAKSAYQADFLAHAPAIVVVCAERSRSFGRERENGVLASAFLLLAAAARGLAGVYLCAYQPADPALEGAIAHLLGLPADVVPVSVLPLGYPAASPGPKDLRPLEELVHDGTFGRALLGEH